MHPLYLLTLDLAQNTYHSLETNSQGFPKSIFLGS